MTAVAPASGGTDRNDATAAIPSNTAELASALFATLAGIALPGADTLGRLPTVQETATAAIDAAWQDARVISFDIFDTLVVRKVASPRDVFLHLATPAPFNTFGLTATELALVRQEAENIARRNGAATRRSGEVTLHEIHAVMAGLLQRAETEVPGMVRAEQLVELALCVAHPHLRGVFARAVAEGKAVWCVSDTYHDADFLRELLTSCGFELAGVHIVSSAERRMSKGEGKLLHALATEAGVAPASVLHIGDHAQSDCRLPREQGFMAVLHPWAASRHTDRPVESPGDAIALGLSQIAARTPEPAFPFWWRFGYSVAGPMLAGFALWLRDRFRQDGIQRAYFLLRDGEIIQDVYDALVGETEGPSRALLESSRRAFALAALPSGRGSITSQLLASENPRPAREFIERFGLSSREYQSAFRAAGLAPDDIVSTHDTRHVSALLTLFGRADILNGLLERAKAERALLLRYLDQEGVLAPGRIALVDIGWNGTIQKSLVALGRIEGRPLDVHGYYLGTGAGITPDLDGSSASGYLFDAGAPAAQANAILELRQLVEFICTTTRGSLRGFRAEGSGVVPVHAPVDHSSAQRTCVAQLRAGAMAFATALAHEQQVFGVQPVSAAAAARPLARIIGNPTDEEARHIGDIRHGEGLGADRVRSLAAFREGPFTAESLLHDHANAYWPRGLLARREPAAMALRALLWMREG